MEKAELVRNGNWCSWLNAGTIEQRESVISEILRPGMISVIDNDLAPFVSLQALEALRDALQEVHRQAEAMNNCLNSKSA